MGDAENSSRLPAAGVKPKVYKVAISSPNEGFTLVEAYDNHRVFHHKLGYLEAAAKHTNAPEQYEFYFYTAGRMFTAYARDLLAEKALQAGMDYILYYDSDMILPMDMFQALFRHKADIVAGLAFTRNPPHLPVMYQSLEGFDGREYFQNTQVRDYPKNSLVELDAVGFGAVLIDCNVLRGMKRPFFMSTSPTGEDILFCYKAKKEVGARIFMDTSVKLGHIGSPKVIWEDDYLEFHSKNPPVKSFLKYDPKEVGALNG